MIRMTPLSQQENTLNKNSRGPASGCSVWLGRAWPAGLATALIGLLSACGGGGGDGGVADIGTTTVAGVGLPVRDDSGQTISGGEVRVRLADGRRDFSIAQSSVLSGVVIEIERHPVNELCRVSASGMQSSVACSKTLINDTGVSDCFEGGVKKECGSGGVAVAAVISGAPLAAAGVSTGTLALQDAAKGRDPESSRLRKLGCGSAGFDFSRLNVNGEVIAEPGGCPTPDTNDARWVCTRDNVTGLVWLRAPSAAAAFGTAVAPAAACGFAGGWRAPAVDELASLIHSGSTDVAIDRVRFPDVAGQIYWTGSPSIRDGNSAYGVQFAAPAMMPGGSVQMLAKTESLPTMWVNRAISQDWRVRRIGDTAQRFAPDFVKGVITDRYSGLMWMLCSVGRTPTASSVAPCSGNALEFTWDGALEQTLAANQGGRLGYADWRLPSRAELVSLADYTADRVTINSDLRGDTQNVNGDGVAYWTSTSMAVGGVQAGAVSVEFKDGTTGIFPTSDRLRVRLVRSIP